MHATCVLAMHAQHEPFSLFTYFVSSFLLGSVVLIAVMVTSYNVELDQTCPKRQIAGYRFSN